MKERILQFLKSENKSSAQFAEDIGVQPSGISHILSGRNNPSLDFVIKMLEKYPLLSTEWLLFGKGRMYRETELQDLFKEFSEPEMSSSSGHVTDLKPETISQPAGETAAAYISEGKDIEKIVWFFNDRSFKEYFPEKK